MGLKELVTSVKGAFAPADPAVAEAQRLIEQYQAEVTADEKTGTTTSSLRLTPPAGPFWRANQRSG